MKKEKIISQEELDYTLPDPNLDKAINELLELFNLFDKRKEEWDKKHEDKSNE